MELPVYLLPVTGADLVLGAPWLATLGPHIADYSALSLKFYLDGKFVTLHGDKPTLPVTAQFHHIMRLSRNQGIDECYTISFHEMQDETTALFDVHLPPELSALLAQYAHVFAAPSGLPPLRMQDHSIPLLQGSNAVK
ncbi:hypothetical protein A2U01_0047797, partial [Trifolium medium]|nr:hypothetical protein [Trifolium medium]